jgi:hypothetical protein
MKCCLGLFVLVLAATPAWGHFVYVLPSAEGSQVEVVFSDSLAADEKVAIEKIAATELFALDAKGTAFPMTCSRTEHSLRGTIPPGAVVIGGKTDYGVANSRHTGNIPVWIQYYPKALLGDVAAASELRLDQRVPLEAAPVVRNGQLQFLALRGGKPLAGATCVILAPGEPKTQQLQTDDEGFAPGRFSKPGRYGVWIKLVDATPGEHGGMKYDRIHTYATLVVDFRPRSAAASAPASK